MKKYCFVSINARFTHSNLAFYYFYQIAKKHDIKLKLLEFTINHPYYNILMDLAKAKPTDLLFSVYIWNSQLVARLLQDVKTILPDTRIILGGPEVSYNPNYWLNNYPAIDMIICGQGEAAFEALITGEKIDSNIVRKPVAFNDVAFPYQDVDLTQLKQRYIYYESSRGCPFRCSYCLSSRSDQRLEYHPLERTLNELDYIIAAKPKIVKFVDRTFNANSNYARTVWKHLIDKNCTTTFHFEIQSELLKEEDFIILRKAPKDLFQFEIGIQSLNPPTLEAINRKADWPIAESNIRQLLSLGNIHIHVDLIAGLPFDDINTFGDAFNKVHELGADNFQLGFLKVLPGTEIQECEQEFGLQYITTAPYEILKNNWISFTEVSHLKEVEMWLDRFHNSGRFHSSLKEILKLHQTPLSFYNRFIEFTRESGIVTDSEKWDNNAQILYRYWSQLAPNCLALIKDTLRWDWCFQANGHYYPDWLATESLKQLKKEYHQQLKALVSSGKINNKQLKKGILFQAESTEFEHFDRLVLFVKDDSKAILRFEI